ncbi:MAG: hypothetical protein GY842_09725 [bacterium]|nr:hypothetical protein [bacterium]
MTLYRMIGLLAVFGALALAVVGLRSEEVRTARRIQRIEMEMIVVRRGLWSTQLEIARWRAPRQVRREVEHWALDVSPPVLPVVEGGDRSRWARVE